MGPKDDAVIKAFTNPAIDIPATYICTDTDMPSSVEDMKDIINKHINRVRKQMERHLEWAILEIAHWKDKCEELEVELISRDAYDVNTYIEQVRPKRRGNF